MYFSIDSASWTRALDMSMGDEEPGGARSISFNLKRGDPFGPAWMRLKSGGDLLGRGKPEWFVEFNMSEAVKDAPWKGVLNVQHTGDEADPELSGRFLIIAL